MKIMCVITGMRSGGAERVMSTICNELSIRNSVSLVVLKEKESDYTLDSRIKIEAGNILDRSFSKSVKFVREQINNWQPDIILAFMTKSNIISIISSKMSKKKPPVVIAERANPYYAEKKYKIIRRFIYPWSSGCVFQTKKAQDYYRRILNCESVVIKNPLNPDFNLQPYIGERKKKIVTVGRLSPEKNQRLLIEAFSQIADRYPEYSVEIYGDGPLKEELRAYIAELNLQNRVYLMGRKNDIQKYIEDASVFVLPSNSEGMPNALIEAMALGLPSIATDCPIGGCAAIVANGENGLLIPMNDVEKMKKAITSIIDNFELAKKLSKNAVSTIENYDAKKVCAEWEKFLLKIADKRGTEK